MKRIWPFLLLLLQACSLAAAPTADFLFVSAKEAYRAGDYSAAVLLFREAALKKPAPGTLQNLGLAEWQSAHTGPAILAWEQALCIAPFNNAARENLRYARKIAQLEAPDLVWYEVVSTWLPINWWAWVCGVSFWAAVTAAFLPGILRLPRRVWQQGLAAAGLAIFLLSVPAQVGVDRRAHLGFITEKETPLRLTPTGHAQYLTRLAAGEPARVTRKQRGYWLIRTSHGSGWVRPAEFGLLCR